MRVFLPLITLFAFATSFGQNKTYTTVRIANWTLEHFPKHYLTKPARVYTEKNPFTGRLTYYQELNEYGKPEGLTVTIQKNDFTSPASAYYTRSGKIVYRAEFFSRSSKASEIVNRNLDDLNDGPQVKREFVNEKVKETITYFDNGKDKSEKNSELVRFNVNGNLDGTFKITYDYFERIRGEKGYSMGLVKDGELQHFSAVYNGASGGASVPCYIEDGFAYIKEFYPGAGDTMFKIKKILRHIKVSRKTATVADETIGDDILNPAVFYLDEAQKFDPLRILDLMTEYKDDYDKYLIKFDFERELLQGPFKGVFLDADVYTEYTGLAEEGKIKSINILVIEKDADSKKDVVTYHEGISDGDSLTYIIKNQDREIISQRRFRITNNISVTNQKVSSNAYISFFDKKDFFPLEVVNKMTRKDESN